MFKALRDIGVLGEILRRKPYEGRHYKGGVKRHRMHGRAFEKLCGAVTYCRENGIIKYILIKNLSGHIGFPKGHSENGESEQQTA